MLFLKDKLFLIAVVCCVLSINTACNSFGNSASTDIELEAQAVALPTLTAIARATDTPRPKPTPTSAPQPTATELKTEIIEPISPVSPIASAEDTMAPTTSGSIQTIPGSEEVLAVAIADLVEQTGTAPDQIVLVSIEEMTWSDSSLGCPQPGFMYAQVITPGYLIVLEIEEEQYKYHTDQVANVIYCQE